MRVFRLWLRRELNVDCPLEFTRDWVLDDVDVLYGPEDFANLLNHGEGVSLREIHDLQLRVQARHHFGVRIDDLALAEGLLHETRGRIFFLVRVGALWHEVGVTAEELAGCWDDSG